jgi:hypothetical protein
MQGIRRLTYSIFLPILGGIILTTPAILLLILFYRAMLKRLTHKKTNTHPYFEAEKLAPSFKGIKSLFNRKGSKHSHPIRRAYRKKVNKHIKQGTPIKRHHNPKNIAELIRQNENIDELTTQYRAARYGR